MSLACGYAEGVGQCFVVIRSSAELLMLYLDFLAILVGSVFDGGGDSVGVGECLGELVSVDLVSPVCGRHD